MMLDVWAYGVNWSSKFLKIVEKSKQGRNSNARRAAHEADVFRARAKDEAMLSGRGWFQDRAAISQNEYEYR